MVVMATLSSWYKENIKPNFAKISFEKNLAFPELKSVPNNGSRQ